MKIKFPKIDTWKKISEEFPDCTCGAYFISGHEWFGIGIWENGKGWTRGFIGEWPYGDAGEIIDEPTTLLNEEVMWWSEIIQYPYCGTRMGDIERKP